MKAHAPTSVARHVRMLVSRQFALFIVVGGFAAAVHWGSRIWLNEFFSFGVALMIAYIIGIATAFTLNKLLVFPESGRELRTEINYFVLFNVAAFPLVWGASMYLAEVALPAFGITWHPREIGHAIAISLPLILNFYLHKFITFREQ